MSGHWILGNGLLTPGDWLQLFLHFMALSLLAIGGAITTAPDMQRFVVRDHAWLTDAQFSASISLAQSAPGPNVLFVAVIGYNLGGLPGVVATMAGTLLPSTALVLSAARYGERHRRDLGLRAFTTGMAPLTIGLLLSTGWILMEPTRGQWGGALLVALTLLLMLRTRCSPLWPISAGAVAGAAGWV
jgi:chromate transporter